MGFSLASVSCLHLLVRSLHLLEGRLRSRCLRLVVLRLHLGVLFVEHGLDLGFLIGREIEQRGEVIHALGGAFVVSTGDRAHREGRPAPARAPCRPTGPRLRTN